MGTGRLGTSPTALDRFHLEALDLSQIATVDTPAAGKPVPISPATPAARGEVTGSGIIVRRVHIDVYAPDPNPEIDKPGVGGHAAGVLLGVWQG